MSSEPRFRVRLYVGYEGTAYSGWQRQANRTETVQQIFETALSRVCNARISCAASGRTDAGVHARIQVVHADIPEYRRTLVENGRFVLALNSLLPGGVRLFKAEAAPPGFSAQRGVVRKTYLYFIDTSPVQQPSARRYSWHLRAPVDWTAIEQATTYFAGTHDFKAFCDADASTKTTVRTLYEARWATIEPPGLFGSSGLRVLRLTGSGFLKHMVRSITGTLIRIGSSSTQPQLIEEVLRHPDRARTGPTAPPQGLWLWDLVYENPPNQKT